jgi:FkbM family methyltransferase
MKSPVVNMKAYLDMAEFGMEGELLTFGTEPETEVVTEVLSGFAYPPIEVPLGDVKLIVDVGSHVGAAAVYFGHLYSGAKIFCFEPNPFCYSRLKTNTAKLNVRTFQYGLSDRDEDAALEGNRSLCAMSIFDRLTSRDQSGYLERVKPEDGIPIKIRGANTVFRELGIENIDILKIDTEGCETMVLASIAAWFPTTKLIYVEYHSDKDRRSIDWLLRDTHSLAGAHSQHVHCGTNSYVLNGLIPADIQKRALP